MDREKTLCELFPPCSREFPVNTRVDFLNMHFRGESILDLLARDVFIHTFHKEQNSLPALTPVVTLLFSFE